MTLFDFQKLHVASRPTRDWGPAKLQDRHLVDYVDDFVINPWTEDEEMMKLKNNNSQHL